MKHKRFLFPAIAVAVIIALALGVFLVLNRVDTTLTFTLRDASSKAWVWDATVRLQDRVIRAYYQSDRSPRPFTFTGLTPGNAELSISAPGYESVTVPVDLDRGENTLAEPIDLLGYEIPNLWQFIVVDERLGTDIVQEIRPVGTDGRAVRNHPAVDLRVVARVAVQMRDGMPVRERVDLGSQRGEELFRGILEPEFDPDPETTFRFSASIPGSAIRTTTNPVWVIDYLLVIGDSRVVTDPQLRAIVEGALELPLGSIEDYLAPFVEQGLLSAHTYTSWNVRGRL